MSEPEFEPTGVPEVDRAVAAVSSLDERDPAAHVAAFESAHQALRGALSPQD